MKILALESSACAASAAVLSDGVLISEQYLNVGLTHSQTLMTLVDGALVNAGLPMSSVDALAVAVGPGSFTGVRIGVATAKGLAFPRSLPVYGVSTLAAMAYLVSGRSLICPAMDARRGQVYTALFEGKGGAVPERLLADSALPLCELAAALRSFPGRDIVLVGDGAQLAFDYLADLIPEVSLAGAAFRFQRAGAVAKAAYAGYLSGDAGTPCDELRPAYLRLSQAERELKKKNSADT